MRRVVICRVTGAMPVADHYPSPGVITEKQVLPNLPSTGPTVSPKAVGLFYWLRRKLQDLLRNHWSLPSAMPVRRAAEDGSG